jgi:hypothetical protein
MVGWLMNDDLEGIWKKTEMTLSMFTPNICLVELRRVSENLPSIADV